MWAGLAAGFRSSPAATFMPYHLPKLGSSGPAVSPDIDRHMQQFLESLPSLNTEVEQWDLCGAPPGSSFALCLCSEADC